RIGPGIQRRLNRLGIYNIGDLARCSLHNEHLLYKEFGINAELLIDHAWGWEPCEMKDIKSYVPTTNSLSNGQVLSKPYPYKKAEMILKEMADVLSMTLFEKNLVTSQISVSVLYDRTSDTRTTDSDFLIDEKGRVFVKPAHGTINMPVYNNSTRMITDYAVRLYESIVDQELLVRKIFIGANEVIPADRAAEKEVYQQMDLFSPVEEKPQESREELEKDRKVQKALLDIRRRYGANSVFKGLNKEEDSTALERNNQVGGHRA
ncbi:MAG: DNA methylase, partial [Erysipelotrichaceae bacterium]|nr:DNA methylase [Erysipelotrichaceae bacterium]